MSKIGTEVIVGQIFKPIITTFTYDELQNYRDNDISIGINNALIFSIPQQELDNESFVDANEETSIWATDNSGLLCPLSFPYSMIAKIKDSLDRYEENINDKKIVSVTWVRTQGTSEAGTSPNINIKVEVKYANDSTALLNVTGIKVYKNPQFTEEYVTVIVGGETINWYDRPGIYYLQGLVTDTSIGSIMGTTNELPLEWVITEIEMLTPTCNSNIIQHNNEYYTEIKLSSNVSGSFKITNTNELNIEDTSYITPTLGRITRNNGTTTFKFYNESHDTLNKVIRYTFEPDNTKYYTNVNDSVTVSVEGIPIPHKYYWYVGNIQPTELTVPAGTYGWTELSSKPTQIKIFREDPNWNDVQWYLAAPAEWEFVTSYNNIQVGGWTKTTITIDNLLYNVWICQALTDTVNVTLTNL